jgi:hypothetical protein
VDARRTRSVEEPLDVRLRRADTYPLLEVRNPLHGTAYLVMLPEFPARDGALCTCTDFARRDLGTCKHIEAAHRWFLEHPDAPPLRPARKVAPAPIWREIDRRRASAEGSLGPDSLRARRAGAVLYERAPIPD